MKSFTASDISPPPSAQAFDLAAVEEDVCPFFMWQRNVQHGIPSMYPTSSPVPVLGCNAFGVALVAAVLLWRCVHHDFRVAGINTRWRASRTGGKREDGRPKRRRWLRNRGEEEKQGRGRRQMACDGQQKEESNSEVINEKN
jgi:hypothetical protein